jgi:small subunit ribosomal protein S9
MSQAQNYATGRRKTSTARVFLSKGTGKITGQRPSAGPVLRPPDRAHDRAPAAGNRRHADQIDVKATVKGGGTTGQAGAIRHGIRPRLISYNEELRPTLRRAGS